MKEKNKAEDYKNFISMGTTGHYPLFYPEWLTQSLSQKQKVNVKKAGHNVKHTFKLLSRHKTIEKKKTALIGMDRVSREEFIRSFFKIVEHESLKRIEKLQ